MFLGSGNKGTCIKNPEKNTKFLSQECPKNINWNPQEERSEIQPKWPGVYETAEVRFGSCAAL